jgi:hypothetical protein
MNKIDIRGFIENTRDLNSISPNTTRTSSSIKKKSEGHFVTYTRGRVSLSMGRTIEIGRSRLDLR